MKSLKLATAALFFAMAACAPYEKATYEADPMPAASTVAYPALALTAIADGQVFEYH